jgi:mannose-6-phosphate isomerase
MNELYPLLMQARFDPRPWGRFDLSPIYSRRFEEKIGESWLTGDNCVVENGPLAGKSLSELASQFKRKLLGDAPRDDQRFPLLLKFLFPAEKLSVQVHPDDAAARAIGEPWGKTECWYVVHAEPGAEIGLGLQRGVTRTEFERAIRENRAEELLNWIKVCPGDTIYVAGGTVHTLGPGSIIVETQQQSDTTFRLYDYGRPRELHLNDGLRVIREDARSGRVKPQPTTYVAHNGTRIQSLVASSYFVVEKFELNAEQAFPAMQGKSSARILTILEGVGVCEAEGHQSVEFAKGDALVVPAEIRRFRIHARPKVEFLQSYVPGVAVPEPETTLY